MAHNIDYLLFIVTHHQLYTPTLHIQNSDDCYCPIMLHSSFSCSLNTAKPLPKSKSQGVPQHSSMDPASFKTIIEQSKDDMVEYRKHKPLDLIQNQNKKVWKDFLDRNAKQKRKRNKRPKFVWERKLRDAQKANNKYIESINDLTRVMQIDDYLQK